MILLNDILNLSEDELKRTKIRFNKDNNDKVDPFEPLTLFIEKHERLYEGQFWNYQKKKSFKVDQIAIGFIKMKNDKWLLFDISTITKDLNKLDGMGYEYETMEKYRKYFGRLIVHYKNTSQNLIRNAKSVIDQCEVHRILDDIYKGEDFPGYENIDLSWNELARVINKEDWKVALGNQKGVYLITDIENGKRYVGAAYREGEMILGRLKDYVTNGHGGNKDLKTLGFDYIKRNFRYSILEIYKSTTDTNIITNREQHWMKILMTKNKKFGYNN